MRFDILTIFPQIFESYLNESIIKRAIESHKIEIHIHDIRDYTNDKHKKVDNTPYGGGPGMVMMAQPIYDCIQAVKKLNKGPVLYMSPRGKTFTQNYAEKLYHKTQNTGLILLCGRYEGIDQRAIDLCVDQEVSIGKYVLTGGELPSLVILDTLSRFVEGVLGDNASIEEESFSKALHGKKEYPHYTKPANFMGLEVPEVLKNGNHAEIKKWRTSQLK